MKTRYNKSKIMKEAHRLMRVEGFTRSQALTLAWDTAKRSEYYLIIKVREPKRTMNMNTLANSLTSYYANNSYNGD